MTREQAWGEYVIKLSQAGIVADAFSAPEIEGAFYAGWDALERLCRYCFEPHPEDRRCQCENDE